MRFPLPMTQKAQEYLIPDSINFCTVSSNNFAHAPCHHFPQISQSIHVSLILPSLSGESSSKYLQQTSSIPLVESTDFPEEDLYCEFVIIFSFFQKNPSFPLQRPNTLVCDSLHFSLAFYLVYLDPCISVVFSILLFISNFQLPNFNFNFFKIY